MYSDYVLAIHGNATHSIGGSSAGHAGVLGGTLERHFCRIQIVLTDINTGQLPYRPHVYGFVERSAVDRPLAKETNNYMSLIAQLGAQSAAGRQRNGSADNSVGSHKAVFGGVHVHTSTASS